MAHRTRSLLVRQRTMAANALRAHLAEFGLVANPGIANLAKLSQKALAEPDGLPAYARRALGILIRRLAELTEEIEEIDALDRELIAWHAGNEASQRLAAIPGIGVITAPSPARSSSGQGGTPLRSGSCHSSTSPAGRHASAAYPSSGTGISDAFRWSAPPQ